MAQSDSRTFKIFWKDQIRRFSGPDKLPWEDFLHQLRMILGPDFHQELRIQYVDDESDKIDLTTQMEWEQCLAILPPGGLVRLYITPGSGIYFKDSPPPAVERFYVETNADHKPIPTTEVLQELSQVVPEVLGDCFEGNKILPNNLPSWLQAAVQVRPTNFPHEVELDIDVDGLFHAIFDKAMSLLKTEKYAFAREFWLKALSLKKSNPTVLYNLACTEALLGNKRASLGYLQQAFEAGFTNIDHAEKDIDLAFLHKDTDFQAVILAARQSLVTVKTEPKEEEEEEEEEVEFERVEDEVKMEEAEESVIVPVITPVVPVPTPVVPEPDVVIPAVTVQVPPHFESQVRTIRSMGFPVSDDFLISLLVACEGDINRVIPHLLGAE